MGETLKGNEWQMAICSDKVNIINLYLYLKFKTNYYIKTEELSLLSSNLNREPQDHTTN
jgi:hypothetical protein